MALELYLQTSGWPSSSPVRERSDGEINPGLNV